MNVANAADGGGDLPVVHIEGGRGGWRRTDFQEIKAYRDLFYFLVWRNVKVLYAQTVLGFAWAILNPLIQILVFTVIFGHVAKIQTDGIPYILFSAVAIVPWTYMSDAMNMSSQSLVSGQNMLGKVYFPRIIFPLTPVFSKLVDFVVSLIIVAGVMLYYDVSPSWSLLYLPVFFVMMLAVPAGLGMWLSALAIRFRDVKFAMQYLIRMLIYTAPILYTASSIPPGYRLAYSLNPIVGVIEGYRASLLGLPVPWEFVLPGLLTSTLLFVTGALYFKKMEHVFADVI